MPAPKTVEAAGEPEATGYTLLVAVDHPSHTEQLLRTAADVAALEGGAIHVVSVVAKDYNSPFGIFADETIREEFAGQRRDVLERALAAGERAGVEVTGEVVVDRSVSRAIVETIERIGADALVVGWTERRRRADAVLGTNVDTLLERAPVDVFVERIGATADGVDAVLVPVAGSQHAVLAARAGYAIAAANGADLTLLSVAGEDVDDATARRGVDAALEELGPLRSEATGSTETVDVEVSVRTSADVADAITTAARDHDVITMGATRGGHLRARLVGSIPREVTDRTDRTVVLARRWTGASRLTQLLGRFRR